MSMIEISLPDDMLSEVRRLAEKDAVAPEEVVARAIADHLAAMRRFEYLMERGKGASREKFLAALRKAPDVEPEPWDRTE